MTLCGKATANRDRALLVRFLVTHFVTSSKDTDPQSRDPFENGTVVCSFLQALAMAPETIDLLLLRIGCYRPYHPQLQYAKKLSVWSWMQGGKRAGSKRQTKTTHPAPLTQQTPTLSALQIHLSRLSNTPLSFLIFEYAFLVLKILLLV